MKDLCTEFYIYMLFLYFLIARRICYLLGCIPVFNITLLTDWYALHKQTSILYFFTKMPNYCIRYVPIIKHEYNGIIWSFIHNPMFNAQCHQLILTYQYMSYLLMPFISLGTVCVSPFYWMDLHLTANFKLWIWTFNLHRPCLHTSAVSVVRP